MAAVPLIDIEPLRPLLSVRPLGVFSDIDGTLAPIVPRPEDARVTRRCRELLRRLIEAGVKVALMTGRPLAVARTMVGLDGAAYVASHGLEYWVKGVEWAEGVAEYAELVEEVLMETGHLEGAGVQVERKGPGMAFHYRRSPDDEAARAAILRAIESPPAVERFTVLEGRKVFELRPKIDVNKGTGTQIVAERLDVKGILCVGDDRTDVDMFHAVSALQEEEVAGRTVAVLSPEVAPDLLDAADYTVDGVEGVEWLLAEVLRVVGETEP